MRNDRHSFKYIYRKDDGTEFSLYVDAGRHGKWEIGKLGTAFEGLFREISTWSWMSAEETDAGERLRYLAIETCEFRKDNPARWRRNGSDSCHLSNFEDPVSGALDRFGISGRTTARHRLILEALREQPAPRLP